MRPDIEDSIFYKGMVEGIRFEAKEWLVEKWREELSRYNTRQKALQAFCWTWGWLAKEKEDLDELEEIEESSFFDDHQDVYSAATWSILDTIKWIDEDFFFILLDETIKAVHEASKEIIHSVLETGDVNEN